MEKRQGTKENVKKKEGLWTQSNLHSIDYDKIDVKSYC